MKYLATYTFSAITFIALTAGFNWLIDPFGMYWSPTLNGVNKTKPEAGTRSRITKAYRAEEIKPSILLVGNSRVEMGLDPSHPAFSNQTVYNQGMPGANLKMQYDYARNVIAGSPTLHTLIIGVDFLDFLVKDGPRPLPVNSPTQKDSYWPRLTALTESTAGNRLFRLKEKAALLFSLDSVKASLTTLLKQSGVVSSITPLGFNTAKTYLDILQHEGIAPLYIQKLDELKLRLENKSLSVVHSDGEPTRHFLQLKSLLDTAIERNIKLYLFISPYHYSYLQLLEDLNFGTDITQWKQQLAALIGNYPHKQIQFWDFSLLNDYTLEPVPIKSSKQQMRWHWEPAHYKKELGDLVLEKMLTSQNKNDFGIRLSQTNIESVIAQERQSLAQSKNQWLNLKSMLNLE